MKNILKGTHVTIAQDISKTIDSHSANNEMKKMRGKPFIVERVEERYGETVIHVGGYMWHPDDVIEIVPRRKSNPFHFNIEELII